MASTLSHPDYGTITLLPFKPDWSSPYSIILEHLTEVLSSRSGREQRRSYHEVPRKAVEFRTTPTRANFRTFLAYMASSQPVLFVSPEITKYVTATAGLTGGGDDLMTVDDSADWIVPGAVLVLSYGGTWGMLLVDDVDTDGTGIEFTTAGEIWPIGTRVYPGLIGFLPSDIASKHPTNIVKELTLRFTVLPGSEPAVTIPAAAETFDDREVFTLKPNWREPPSVNHVWPSEDVDYGRGVIARFQPIEFPKTKVQARYTGRTAAEARALEMFFRRVRGQQVEFFMPTWENNLPLTDNLASGAFTLRTPGSEVFDHYDGSTVYTSIVVVMRDGTRYNRKVTGIAFSGGNSVLTVAVAWPSTIDADDVLMVCWLPVCRLASDEFDLDWLTDGVAEVQLTIQSLEDIDLTVGDLP